MNRSSIWKGSPALMAAAVRMNPRMPALVLRLLQRQIRVLPPALIEVVCATIGQGRPDDLRHRLGQETKLFLTVLPAPKRVRERRARKNF
ncbi:MAG: hypothetical protein DME26_04185 [Verrucomicrobia bacterium]|nr:MAG: hypothetical protein DME26_04185 [Verrucomicrobiota bacterium]